MIERLLHGRSKDNGFIDITDQDTLAPLERFNDAGQIITRATTHIEDVSEDRTQGSPGTLQEGEVTSVTIQESASPDPNNYYTQHFIHGDYAWKFGYRRQRDSKAFSFVDEDELTIMKEDITKRGSQEHSRETDTGYEFVEIHIDQGKRHTVDTYRQEAQIKYTDYNRTKSTGPGDYQARNNDFAVQSANELLTEYIDAYADYLRSSAQPS